MMTLEEVWENLRQDPETKATMEEAEKSYKLFKKIENLIVTDLEAKLAESEKSKEINIRERDKICLEMATDYNKQILELKQQLAEKDQAIEGLQEINQSLGQTCNNDAKEIERLREKENLLNLIVDGYYTPTNIVKRQIREQNQTAIAELEKVKAKVRDVSGALALCEIEVQIDQQIKLLKGENENV